MKRKIGINKNNEHTTAVLQDLGGSDKLKLRLLFAKGSVLNQKIGKAFPKPRKAPKRCVQHIFRTYAESFSLIFPKEIY